MPPPPAAAADGKPTLGAAEWYLLQLFKAHLRPQRDQLVQWRQAMKALQALAQGHAKLDRFWADYEVRGWVGQPFGVN